MDPAGASAASRRAEELLLQLCGGESRGVTQTGDATGGGTHDVTLRLERVRQVLGADLPAGRIEEILTGFGLKKASGNESETDWRIPSFRPDLAREIDLIEEVARVYGLDHVPGRAEGRFAPASPTDHTYDFLMATRRQLVGLGFAETRSVSLVKADPGAGSVPLKNPLTEDGAVLRGTLLPGLLAAAGRNVRQGSADLRLFEVGRVFSTDIPAGEPEPWSLGLVMTGAAQPPAWRHGNGGSTLDFHDLRGVVERLVAPATVELSPAPLEGGAFALRASVAVNGKPIGAVAQLSPSRVKELGLRGEVLGAELKISALREVATGPRVFTPLARFPSVTRDLAVVADRAVAHGEISSALLGANEPLLASVELFDVFTDDRGEKIAADKKSLAYSLTYRAEDRTLKTEEVNAAHARLKAVLQGHLSDLQFRE